MQSSVAMAQCCTCGLRQLFLSSKPGGGGGREEGGGGGGDSQ